MTGLFSASDTVDIKEKDANGRLVFLDGLFTMEYQNIAHRLVTPVDVSACVDGSPLFRMDAIWDTGATTSCISEPIARKMGLLPIEKGVGVSTTGQTDISYYLVDVSISPTVRVPNLKVGGFPMENHDGDFIVGMDIISKGKLCVESKGGATGFSFEFNG